VKKCLRLPKTSSKLMYKLLCNKGKHNEIETKDDKIEKVEEKQSEKESRHMHKTRKMKQSMLKFIEMFM
jgi:hypothetical protein